MEDIGKDNSVFKVLLDRCLLSARVCVFVFWNTYVLAFDSFDYSLYSYCNTSMLPRVSHPVVYCLCSFPSYFWLQVFDAFTHREQVYKRCLLVSFHCSEWLCASPRARIYSN